MVSAALRVGCIFSVRPASLCSFDNFLRRSISVIELVRITGKIHIFMYVISENARGYPRRKIGFVVGMLGTEFAEGDLRLLVCNR